MRSFARLALLLLLPLAASAGDVRVFKDKSGVINIVSSNSRLPGTGERYYKRVDSNGTVHFTSKPPMSGGYSVVYVDACPACNVSMNRRFYSQARQVRFPRIQGAKHPIRLSRHRCQAKKITKAKKVAEAVGIAIACRAGGWYRLRC